DRWNEKPCGDPKVSLLPWSACETNLHSPEAALSPSRMTSTSRSGDAVAPGHWATLGRHRIAQPVMAGLVRSTDTSTFVGDYWDSPSSPEFVRSDADADRK